MRCPLTIAGTDPTGGAGVQSDIRVFASMGLHPLSVVACVTAQNQGDFSIVSTVAPEGLSEQFRMLFDGFEVGAAKTGLLGDDENVRAVARALGGRGVPLVVDPVLSSSAGTWKASGGMVSAYLEELIPIAYLVTPNIPEAGRLLGRRVRTPEEVERACMDLHAIGARHVLVKGGHLGGDRVVDTLFDGERFHRTEKERVPGPHHGTGCMLSAHIVASLVQGHGAIDAFKRASGFIGSSIVEGTWIKGTTYLDADNKDRDPLMKRLGAVVSEIGPLLPATMLPEVGSNIGFAREDAKGPDDVCALTGRLHRVGNEARAVGELGYGASKHIARIILTAMASEPGMRAVMNLKFSDATIEKARNAGMSTVEFSRDEEPGDASSMEWGTKVAIERYGAVPDVIFDRGGVGKEPMIRVLGRDPEDVLGKIRKLI